MLQFNYLGHRARPMRGSVLIASLFFLALALGVGCSENANDDEQVVPDMDVSVEPDTTDDVGSGTVDTESVTEDVVSLEGPLYYGEVDKILQDHCVGCHSDNGIGPFHLDNYESVFAVRAAVQAAVESELMPPWHASEDCREYKASRRLPPAEKDLLIDWLMKGAPSGEEDAASDVVEPVAPAIPDLVLTAAESYTPPSDAPDTYRCLTLEYDFDEDMFVKGLIIEPDQVAQVHHVIISAIPEAALGELAAKENEDAEIGYECFGAFGINSAIRLTSWVPGDTDPFLAEGRAYAIPAGSKLVMQMHYNMIAGGSKPDRSKLNVYLYDGEPEYIMQSVFLINPNIAIEPGDPASEHISIIPNESNLTASLTGLGPHMHLRGSALSVDLIRASGEEECLLDVPRYDFNWQEGYQFHEGDEVEIGPGDAFRLRCVYDNSLENQPIENGEPMPPKLLTWGDGTEEEMCLAGLSFRIPYAEYLADTPQAFGDIVVGDSAAACVDLEPCIEACDDPHSYTCIANCSTQSLGCLQCTLEKLDDACGSDCYDGVDVMSCVVECVGVITSGAMGLGDCIEDVCPDVAQTLNTCFEPYLESDACGDLISVCGK